MTTRNARIRLLGTIVLWIVAYLALSAGYVGMSVQHPGELAARRAVVCVFGFLICVLGLEPIHRATRAWPFYRRLILALVSSAVAAVIYGEANFAIFYLYRPLWGEGVPEHLTLLLYVVRLMVWVFLAWSALYFAVEYDDAAHEQQLRLAAAQSLAVDAQNRMLRYQINPHFLFNTLNALSTLILEKDTARAERMILALSTFLRHSLEKDLGDKIALDDEIEVQTKYLSIEQIRFGDRLRFVDHVPHDLRETPVPSMILQPLVENAVKHGVGAAAEPVTIELSARKVGEAIEITLADDATPSRDRSAPPKLGVGLENVRRRLQAEYGAGAALTCDRRQPAGFTVTLRIPLDQR